ncbi:MAG: o-succinylbenzoate synthase [Pelagibacteraceae bacterium TMED237]|nr:o-succinylbenzoate synthase [Candidatus Neomarinimicrobiota bacterium]OUW96310.1 MAG: o-succinylbenzoate synthase [Pelagibacteraceae bacterium TMED237]|tara:strand:+ start:3209 stop:4225 length:1017 start_codon:yes stop_codon:yes gene_type:complete
MNIVNTEILEYKKAFISDTNLGVKKHSFRKGWYIKIFSNEHVGIGEAAPIPGISKESHAEAGYAIQGFMVALKDVDYSVSIDEMLLLAEVHGCNVPSAKFAMQAAVYSLFSQNSNKIISKFLNQESNDSIMINSIVHDNSRISIENSRVLKIKVSDSNIYDIKDMIEKIYNSYGEKLLRLDFNGGLDLSKAIRICKELESYNIEYIEQPVLLLDDLYELRMHSGIPIAVDEILLNYDTAEKIIKNAAADVFVIKPTLLGGFDDLKKVFQLANSEEIKIVITSAFETFIGQSFIGYLAAAIKTQSYCGIFNINLFENDHLYPSVKNSKLVLKDICGFNA